MQPVLLERVWVWTASCSTKPRLLQVYRVLQPLDDCLHEFIDFDFFPGARRGGARLGSHREWPVQLV